MRGYSCPNLDDVKSEYPGSMQQIHLAKTTEDKPKSKVGVLLSSDEPPDLQSCYMIGL